MKTNGIGRASHLLEWSLALEAVLESREDAGLDGAAWARRFDFVRGGAAEKLFLKLLFPVEYRARHKEGPPADVPAGGPCDYRGGIVLFLSARGVPRLQM